MFNIKAKDIILIPNLISILRILLLIPFSIFLIRIAPPDLDTIINLDKIITLSIVILMVLTDFLDGFLARKLRQTSELGKILDPFADKVAFITGAAMFTIFKGFPLWIMIFIIIRDTMVFLVGTFISKKKKEVVQSNIWGKLSTFVLSLAFLSVIIFGVYFIATAILLLLGLAIFSYATINYAIAFFLPDKIKNKKVINLIILIIFFIILAIIIMLGIMGYFLLPEPFWVLNIYS